MEIYCAKKVGWMQREKFSQLTLMYCEKTGAGTDSRPSRLRDAGVDYITARK